MTIVVSWSTVAIAGETKNRDITKTIFKNVELIGYQGFTTFKEFMCLDPLDYEKKFEQALA